MMLSSKTFRLKVKEIKNTFRFGPLDAARQLGLAQNGGQKWHLWAFKGSMSIGFGHQFDISLINF